MNNNIHGSIYDNLEDNDNHCLGCHSSVAWSAVIAGALSASAVSLLLLILGSGLGMAAASPWSFEGANTKTFTIGAAIWLIIMQLISAGAGGYLAGRLRNRWVNIHIKEASFRDWVHGFLAWAVATIIAASFLASAASAVVSGGAKAASAIAAGAATGAASTASGNEGNIAENQSKYLVDRLFRSDNTTDEKNMHTEASRILISGMIEGTLASEDRQYLAEIVAKRANVTNDEANRRIEEAITKFNQTKEKAKENIDDARKAAMKTALFMFIALIIGAFIASYMAAVGGRHRDRY